MERKNKKQRNCKNTHELLPDVLEYEQQTKSEINTAALYQVHFSILPFSSKHESLQWSQTYANPGTRFMLEC